MITLAAILFWFALVGGVMLLVWPLCRIGVADVILNAELEPHRTEQVGRYIVTFYEDNPEAHHGR